MKPSVSIRKPCTEDWGKMTAARQGRHCQVCCKTVVDFSTKTDRQIVDYLEAHAQQRVCGRFKASQVNAPAPQSRSRYRVFLAALVIVFGGFLFTSCGNSTNEHVIMGDIAYEPDTVMVPQPTGAGIGALPDTLKKKAVCPKPEVIEDPEHYIMGDIAYDPNDTLR